jgi:hypothetical protein
LTSAKSGAFFMPSTKINTMKKHRKQTKDELDRLTYSSITFIGCMLGMIALTVIAKLAGY